MCARFQGACCASPETRKCPPASQCFWFQHSSARVCIPGLGYPALCVPCCTASQSPTNALDRLLSRALSGSSLTLGMGEWQDVRAAAGSLCSPQVTQAEALCLLCALTPQQPKHPFSATHCQRRCACCARVRRSNCSAHIMKLLRAVDRVSHLCARARCDHWSASQEGLAAVVAPPRTFNVSEAYPSCMLHYLAACCSCHDFLHASSCAANGHPGPVTQNKPTSGGRVAVYVMICLSGCIASGHRMPISRKRARIAGSTQLSRLTSTCTMRWRRVTRG